MNALERLRGIEQIKQLKARYFRYLDTKNWEALRSIFAPTAEFDLRAANSVRQVPSGVWMPPIAGDDHVFRGRDNIVAVIRGVIDPVHAVHHGHVPEIDILSATSACGIWPMEAVLRYPSGDLLFNSFGHYHDTYEDAGSGWTVQTSRLTRLWMTGGLTLDCPGDIP